MSLHVSCDEFLLFEKVLVTKPITNIFLTSSVSPLQHALTTSDVFGQTNFEMIKSFSSARIFWDVIRRLTTFICQKISKQSNIYTLMKMSQAVMLIRCKLILTGQDIRG